MNREEIDAFLGPYGMEMVDVLEPWKANLAQVVWFDGKNLLLEADHTAFAIVDSKQSWKQIRKWIGAHTVTMLHAPFDETEDLKEDGFEKLIYQKTVYYPKKEPVAVQLPDTVTLQWLSVSHLAEVTSLSSHTDEDYLRTCIQDGMLGAFMDDKLVGIIGTHKERAMGLLEVLPEYHSHHIGYYLEAAMINACLLQDRVPFARISIDNTASLQMQERLGMVINEHIVQVLLP